MRGELMIGTKSSPFPQTSFDRNIRSRISKIMKLKYIHTPQNEMVWNELEDLMLQFDPESPPPKVKCIILMGSPDSGKTTCCRQFKAAFLNKYPMVRENKIVFLRLTGRILLRGFAAKLCRRIGVSDVPPNPSRNWTTDILLEKAAHKLFRDETELVIVDEVQNLIKLQGEPKTDILKGFNDLLNESHTPIALIGVEGVDKILQIAPKDDKENLWGTFCSRFMEIGLKEWNKDEPDDDAFILFLRTIYNRLELSPLLKTVPFYRDDDTRKLILELTDGLTGRIINLLKWSARDLIRKRQPEVITPNLLRRINEKLQKERQTNKVR